MFIHRILKDGKEVGVRALADDVDLNEHEKQRLTLDLEQAAKSMKPHPDTGWTADIGFQVPPMNKDVRHALGTPDGRSFVKSFEGTAEAHFLMNATRVRASEMLMNLLKSRGYILKSPDGQITCRFDGSRSSSYLSEEWIENNVTVEYPEHVEKCSRPHREDEEEYLVAEVIHHKSDRFGIGPVEKHQVPISPMELRVSRYIAAQRVYRTFCHLYKDVLSSYPQDMLKTVRRFVVSERKHIFNYIQEDGIRAQQLCNTFPVIAWLIAKNISEDLDLGSDRESEVCNGALRRTREQVLEGVPVKKISQDLGIDPIFSRIPPQVVRSLPVGKLLSSLLSWHGLGAPMLESFGSKKDNDVRDMKILADYIRRFSKGWKLYHYRYVVCYQGPGYRNIHRQKIIDWQMKNLVHAGKTYRDIIDTYQHMSDWMRESNRYQYPQGTIRPQRSFDHRMSFAHAKEASDRWHRDVAIAQAKELEKRAAELDKTFFPDPWLPSNYGKKDLAIVHIHTEGELYREGAALNHCVGSYARRIHNGAYCVYGVRRTHEGQECERVATVGLTKDRKGKVVIDQVSGRSNNRTTSKVQRFVEQFVSKHQPKTQGANK